MATKNKFAFEVTHASYQNQQNATVQLLEQQQPNVKIKQEQIEDEKDETVEEKRLPLLNQLKKEKMLPMINFF